MQPNTITLPVDVLNNGTTVDKVFTRYDEYQNRSVYVSPSHTMESRDTLSFYRTQPKPSGNFKGVSKVAAKFSEDKLVTGADGVSQLTAPLIVDIAASIPVGVSWAQVLKKLQEAIALLDQDAIMSPLTGSLMI